MAGMELLEQWLTRVNARRLWEQSLPSGDLLTCYEINNDVVLLQQYKATIGGWNLFVPSSKTSDAAATIDGAARFLDVVGARGQRLYGLPAAKQLLLPIEGVHTVYTTGQVAKFCGVCPATAAKWIDSGRLMGFRIGVAGQNQHRRVSRKQLLAFMTENGITIPPELKFGRSPSASSSGCSDAPLPRSTD